MSGTKARQQSEALRDVALQAAKEAVRLADSDLLAAALTVINKHNLATEFAHEYVRLRTAIASGKETA